eukprot:snap_masked-scaffold_2-processed-gene-9.22-mRNA-1 protein AED:1.00 eAED:1.00 QI:0/0/0/0/1/1/2/0/125
MAAVRSLDEHLHTDHRLRSTAVTALHANGASNKKVRASSAGAQQYVQQSEHEEPVRAKMLKKLDPSQYQREEGRVRVRTEKGELVLTTGSNMQSGKMDFGITKMGTLTIHNHFRVNEAKIVVQTE